MTGKETLCADSPQVAAVKAYEEARQAMRDASARHTAAWRVCREAGLEHRMDAMGRSRWAAEKGDWRPVAGEPIRG